MPGQLAPHFVPSQVADPPCGAEHAVHDVPHEAIDVLSAQPPLHGWKPVPHEKPQRWLAPQLAVP